MADKPTALEINLDKIRNWKVKLDDDEIVLNDYEVRVGRNRDPHTTLETFHDLSKTGQVDIRLKTAGKVINIDIPAEMKNRLAGYLADDRYPFYNTNFDCVSFVNFMLGQPYKFGAGVDLDRFNLQKVNNIHGLNPGDIVHFAQGEVFKNSNGRHAALYIGEGYFLSKLGDWKISVQDVDQIKKHYRGDNFFKQVTKN